MKTALSQIEFHLWYGIVLSISVRPFYEEKLSSQSKTSDNLLELIIIYVILSILIATVAICTESGSMGKGGN